MYTRDMERRSDYQKEENKMPFFNNENISIAAMACAVPDNLVTVDSFSNAFGQEVTDRFTDGTGIKQMYKALPEQTAGDIAYAAAENLMEHYPVDKDKIGALILVTQSPDYRRPATACVLQKRLGLSKDCAVMDIGLGCSGFVYGLQVASSLMASSDMEYALLPHIYCHRFSTMSLYCFQALFLKAPLLPHRHTSLLLIYPVG